MSILYLHPVNSKLQYDSTLLLRFEFFLSNCVELVPKLTHFDKKNQSALISPNFNERWSKSYKIKNKFIKVHAHSTALFIRRDFFNNYLFNELLFCFRKMTIFRDRNRRHQNKNSISLDSNHLLGQRGHFVGSSVGLTSTNDVSPVSFCLSGQLNCQSLVRCWSNARSPASPAYADVMPTILLQVSRWANVGPIWFMGTIY